jgi:REP element-mobilizing transposase RayT/arsenate reductase-like glutaredoxin family protein
MPRKARIESAGFHHIYNRGVEKRLIFNDDLDKDKFLDIIDEVSTLYGFTIHAYVLMNNHYHLLLENSEENLSRGMRQINATYAQYFNKKYKRVGHLWQDRFKSWYVFDDNYLFTLFKYIEFNPIKAKIAKEVGEYNYTLAHDILEDRLKNCMKNTFVLEWYSSAKGILSMIDLKITKLDVAKLDRFKKESYAYKNNPIKVKKRYNISQYFNKALDKNERNKQIHRAYKDNFSQSEIARFLNLSISTISKIIKIQNSTPDP